MEGGKRCKQQNVVYKGVCELCKNKREGKRKDEVTKEKRREGRMNLYR